MVALVRLDDKQGFIAGLSKSQSVYSGVFWSLGIPLCLFSPASSGVYRILSHFLQC